MVKRKFEREKVLIVNGKKIGGWLVRVVFAAVGCSSMGAGSIGGKNYCGNLLWQSSVTLLPPENATENATENSCGHSRESICRNAGDG